MSLGGNMMKRVIFILRSWLLIISFVSFAVIPVKSFVRANSYEIENLSTVTAPGEILYLALSGDLTEIEDIDCYYEKDGGEKIPFYCDSSGTVFGFRPSAGQYVFSADIALSGGGSVTTNRLELDLGKLFDYEFKCEDVDPDDDAIELSYEDITKCNIELSNISDKLRGSVVSLKPYRYNSSSQKSEMILGRKPIKIKKKSSVVSIPFKLVAAKDFEDSWHTTDSYTAVTSESFEIFFKKKKGFSPITRRKNFQVTNRISINTGFYSSKDTVDDFEPGKDF